jgi:hypothetical protein
MKMLFLMLLVANVAACVPYPIYKTLKPEARFLVQDTNTKRIEGVQIVLNMHARPTPIDQFDMQYTDSNGMSQFVGKKELQIEHTGMHGSVHYYWIFCFEKSGFKTVEKQIVDASELSSLQVISMVPGKTESCRVNGR